VTFKLFEDRISKSLIKLVGKCISTSWIYWPNAQRQRQVVALSSSTEMPNELNRKIKGTILKGHRHLSVKHGQQGIKSLMDRDLISGSSSFPKETKDFQEKMIESICIKNDVS